MFTILVQHFKKKFSKLIEQYGDVEIVFGKPRIEATAPSTITQLQETQAQLQETRATIKRVRKNFQRTKDELAGEKAQIAAMETSKFWRIRARWIRAKQALRSLRLFSTNQN